MKQHITVTQWNFAKKNYPNSCKIISDIMNQEIAKEQLQAFPHSFVTQQIMPIWEWLTIGKLIELLTNRAVGIHLGKNQLEMDALFDGVPLIVDLRQIELVEVLFSVLLKKLGANA